MFEQKQVNQATGGPKLLSQKEFAETVAAVNQLYTAMKGGVWGAGTDENSIFSALENKTPNQIESIKAIYKDRTGCDLEQDLKSELGGSDLAKATKLLLGTSSPSPIKATNINPDESLPSNYQNKIQSALKGNNSAKADALRLQYAMDGMGTDEDKIKQVLGDKTKAQIATISAEYGVVTGGRNLQNDLNLELSGRDLFSASEALRGTPTIAAEYVERANRELAFERSNSFSTTVMDTFSSRGKILEEQNKRLNDYYQQAQATGVIDANSTQRIRELSSYSSAEAKDYGQAKDTVSEGVATAGATAAAGVAIVATGGIALPAIAGAASYALTKNAVQGASYDEQGFVTDLAVGGVDGALTALTGGANQVIKGGMISQGAIAGAGGGVVRQAINENTWQSGAVDGILQTAKAAFVGAAGGAAGGSVFAGVKTLGGKLCQLANDVKVSNNSAVKAIENTGAKDIAPNSSDVPSRSLEPTPNPPENQTLRTTTQEAAEPPKSSSTTTEPNTNVVKAPTSADVTQKNIIKLPRTEDLSSMPISQMEALVAENEQKLNQTLAENPDLLKNVFLSGRKEGDLQQLLASHYRAATDTAHENTLWAMTIRNPEATNINGQLGKEFEKITSTVHGHSTKMDNISVTHGQDTPGGIVVFRDNDVIGYGNRNYLVAGSDRAEIGIATENWDESYVGTVHYSKYKNLHTASQTLRAQEQALKSGTPSEAHRDAYNRAYYSERLLNQSIMDDVLSLLGQNKMASEAAPVLNRTPSLHEAPLAAKTSPAVTTAGTATQIPSIEEMTEIVEKMFGKPRSVIEPPSVPSARTTSILPELSHETAVSPDSSGLKAQARAKSELDKRFQIEQERRAKLAAKQEASSSTGTSTSSASTTDELAKRAEIERALRNKRSSMLDDSEPLDPESAERARLIEKIIAWGEKEQNGTSDDFTKPDMKERFIDPPSINPLVRQGTIDPLTIYPRRRPRHH